MTLDEIKLSDNLLKTLFNTLIEFTLAQGGDGCGYLVCGKYYSVDYIADEFEKELRTRGWFGDVRVRALNYHRKDYEGYTLFTDRSNENFVISQKSLRDPYKDIEIIL